MSAHETSAGTPQQSGSYSERDRVIRRAALHETAHAFGQDDALIGIIHHAAHADDSAASQHLSDAPGLPGVIILNAGIDSRIGPKRLYVGMARWLASSGLNVIRFDYGGLGESRKSVYTADDTHRQDFANVDEALVEARLAMDFLHQQTGVERFIVVGLCSGADDAHRLALLDPRICGVVLIDGYGYRNWRFWLEHYSIRLFSGRRWANFFQRKFPGLFGKGQNLVVDADAQAREDVWFYAMPKREQMQAQLETLMARGVKLLYIYSGETHEYYNHKNQFRQAFSDIDFGEQLVEHFIPQADHTFTRAADRIELLKHMQRWADAYFLGKRR